MLFQTVENGRGLPATITPLSNTVSVNTPKLRGMLSYLHVESLTGTTTFDFQIIDWNSRIVRRYEAETGYINDSEPLPLDGKYTLKIVNASVDEKFKILLVLKEKEG